MKNMFSNGLTKAAVLTLPLLLTGCMSSMNMGSSSAKTTATGSAGGANSQNANSQLQRCEQSLGTVTIYEDRDSDWYTVLTRDYRLTSTVPVIRLLAQQSNCFVIVERGKAFNQMMEERALMESGELRKNSNFKKGQMVAASTVLTLIENRSGVQLAAAEGSARNTDFAGLGGLFGGSAGGALGAYAKTPEGKVIVAAFTDSMNNLIDAVKNYKMQSVKGGLGAGGTMKVAE